AQARAVELIERDPTPFVHYFIAETGGLLEPHEFQTWRLLHAAPQPYTRERFDDTYNWTVKWNMTVPGATYENTVDNREWEYVRAGSLKEPPRYSPEPIVASDCHAPLQAGHPVTPGVACFIETQGLKDRPVNPRIKSGEGDDT